MNQIQAIILDVDGVIIGEKIGFNSPHPHQKVLEALQKVCSGGVPVVLCTAKPAFAIRKIIEEAELDNLHIADGGGLVVNPLSNKVLSKHLIDGQLVKEIVDTLIDRDIYTEIYTPTEYLIQTSQAGQITQDHQLVLQTLPRTVTSLAEEAAKLEVIKIMPIAKNLEHKEFVSEVLQKFTKKVVVSWGVHPVILPLQFGIVTNLGISKNIAVGEILQNLSIKIENVLGVGDSLSDWQFIKPCGYGATLANAPLELKDLVGSKGPSNSFLAPSVDEHGVIEIFRYFGLI